MAPGGKVGNQRGFPLVTHLEEGQAAVRHVTLNKNERKGRQEPFDMNTMFKGGAGQRPSPFSGPNMWAIKGRPGRQSVL